MEFLNPIETCARCGHSSGRCPRCERADALLGGHVHAVGALCHTFVEDRPSCYELTVAERHAAADDWLPADAPALVAAFARPRRFTRDPGRCHCECNSGGFCGGCGHAGCGRR